MSAEDSIQYDVYEHKTSQGSSSFYSKGVKRDFGENKIVHVKDGQVFTCVQPLHDSNGLELVGYLYAEGQ
jgi:hypothetical protein